MADPVEARARALLAVAGRRARQRAVAVTVLAALLLAGGAAMWAYGTHLASGLSPQMAQARRLALLGFGALSTGSLCAVVALYAWMVARRF